jgi:hypothetical protein
MDPWWKTTTPRKEVSARRSFNLDEFAIALEQVVAGTPPDDYKKLEQFFSRNLDRTSHDSPTLYQRSTRNTVTKCGFSMPCSWQCRGTE